VPLPPYLLSALVHAAHLASASKLQYADPFSYGKAQQPMKPYFKKYLVTCVGLWLVFSDLLPPLNAQDPPAHIDLVVAAGDGVTVNPRQRPPEDPAVRVEDDDHRPVAGATVVFSLPVSGTTGEFTSGSKSLTVITGPDGIATAHAIRVNEVPGRLQIYVAASYRGLRARTLVNQVVAATPGAKTPTTPPHESKSSGKWKWIVVGVVAAAGAGAGAYLGTHSSSTPPVSVSTGAVVFGSPK